MRQRRNYNRRPHHHGDGRAPDNTQPLPMMRQKDKARGKRDTRLSRTKITQYTKKESHKNVKAARPRKDFPAVGPAKAAMRQQAVKGAPFPHICPHIEDHDRGTPAVRAGDRHVHGGVVCCRRTLHSVARALLPGAVPRCPPSHDSIWTLKRDTANGIRFRPADWQTGKPANWQGNFRV